MFTGWFKVFENEDIRNYYFIKFLQSYLYDDEIYQNAKKGYYDIYIYNNDFLAILINFIEVYLDSEYAYSDLSIKPKLYEIINYIRHNANYADEDTKKYYYDVFNDFLLRLNQMDNNITNYEWVLYEISIRVDIKLPKQITLNRYEKYENFVRQSLGYDFILLTYLSDEVDEKTFDDSIESLANDEFFFASLNVIVKQCPEVLAYPCFKERVKKVIAYNKANLNLFRDDALENKIFIIRQNRKYLKNFS